MARGPNEDTTNFIRSTTRCLKKHPAAITHTEKKLSTFFYRPYVVDDTKQCIFLVKFSLK